MKSEIVIVGGGPAGSTAAKILAEYGYKVTVIEKGPPGRNKVCGGGTSEGCIKNFPYVRDKVIHQTNYLTQMYEDLEMTYKLKIYHVERHDFDTYLMELAKESGAKIMYNTSVTEVDLNNRRVKLDNGEIIPYEKIIGADGASSIVALTMGRRYQMVPIVQANIITQESNSDTAYVYHYKELMGYAWIFPKGIYSNVGLGGKSNGYVINELWGRFKSSLRGNEKENVNTDKAWVIPYTEEPYRISKEHENAYLIGDAAGYVNAMTGEGIFFAMKSGEEIAKVIAGKMKYNDFPSFYPKLMKIIQMAKDAEKDFKRDPDRAIRKAFENPKENEKLIKYLFEDMDEDIEVPRYSDEEKVNKYKQILKNLR